MNYYNEWDKSTAAWLRELIRRGLVPPGDVDERSITEVKSHELTKYTQCHFFAGIGGWSLALRLARLPSGRRLWTGSCPCQPFSGAQNGDEQGADDERHLWPAFFGLIRECRPNLVFGEQVEAAIKHGWLDGIQADLEGENYAVGSCVLGSHSVGSPSKRQRLYWVANANRYREEPRDDQVSFRQEEGREVRGSIQAWGPSYLGIWATYGEAIGGGSGGRYRVALEPESCPLANGISERMGLHHGYGNAINPHTAAAFIRAAEAARVELRGSGNDGNVASGLSAEDFEL